MKASKGQKKKGKKILWIVLLVVALGIGFLVYKGSKQQPVSVPTVQTVVATRGDLQEEISVSGTVAGMESVIIYAPASGTIKKVFERTGDEISAGTLLAEYDLEKLEQDLYQAKLQNERTQIAYDISLDNNSKGNGKVKEADTNLAVLEQQISDHEAYLKKLQKELSDYRTKAGNDQVLQNYNLTKRLEEQKARLTTLTPGSEEYDQLVKEMEETEKALEQLSLQSRLSTTTEYEEDLEKRITQEQETLAELQEYKAKMESQKATGEATVLDNYGKRQLEIDMELTDLSYQKLLEEAELAREGISTEVQGVLTGLTVAPGSTVATGMQIATMERSDQLKITASATKYALTRLRVGQKVDAVIGDKTYPARISHIDRIASPGAMNSSAVAFEAELLEKDEQIYLGMDAKMTIYTNKAEDAFLLPTEAVNANKDGDFVYVVQNGKIAIKPIKVGIISKGSVEIIEGITESDQIVLEYSGSLEEGMEVLATPAD